MPEALKYYADCRFGAQFFSVSLNNESKFATTPPSFFDTFASNFLALCKIIFLHFLKIFCYLSSGIGFEFLIYHKHFKEKFQNLKKKQF